VPLATLLALAVGWNVVLGSPKAMATAEGGMVQIIPTPAVAVP
jgi:hypothetical protein